jgi:hypothetical protein
MAERDDTITEIFVGRGGSGRGGRLFRLRRVVSAAACRAARMPMS